MLVMLQGAGLAGYGFLVPLGIGYVLALSYAFSFSELALMFPRAGTLSTYTEVAIGHFPAILAVFAGYVVVAMFALSAELVLIDLVLAELFPGLLPPMVSALAIIAFFTAMNIRGVDVFAKLQSALAFIMVLALLAVSLMAIFAAGVPRMPSPNLLAESNPMGWGVLALTALAIWGFVGAEFVCPLVEETKEPERNTPRSMIAGITIILVVYALFCVGALAHIPREALAGSPLPHLTYFKAVLGEEGLILLAIAAFTATCSTVNTSLAAVPRMIYGMAKNGQTFEVLGALHPTYKTPWAAILFVAIATAVPMLFLSSDPDAILVLLTGASVSWLIAYIIAHIDVIVLRMRMPHAARPFRTPFYPLPQLFGIIGMGVGIFYAAPSPELEGKILSSAGVVLLIGCLISAVWVRFVMGKGLFAPEPAEVVLGD